MPGGTTALLTTARRESDARHPETNRLGAALRGKHQPLVSEEPFDRSAGRRRQRTTT